LATSTATTSAASTAAAATVHLVALLLALDLNLLLSEEFILNLADRLKEHVDLLKNYYTVFSEVSIERRQEMLVDS